MATNTPQNRLMSRIFQEVPLAGRNPDTFMGFITGIQMGVYLCRNNHGDMEKWWTFMEAGLTSEDTKKKIASDIRSGERSPEDVIDNAMAQFYQSADKMLTIARSVDNEV